MKQIPKQINVLLCTYFRTTTTVCAHAFNKLGEHALVANTNMAIHNLAVVGHQLALYEDKKIDLTIDKHII